jgi:superfamily I DNA and RNA helicase
MEDEDAVVPPEAARREGAAPTVVMCDTIEEEVRAAVAQVKRWSKTSKRARSVAVLYCREKEDGVSRTEALVSALRHDAVDFFWVTNPDERKARDRMATIECPVVLSTVQSAKGLEFPRVVMCGVWNGMRDLTAARRVAYIGMTRASDELTIVARTDQPLAADLAPT